MKRVQISTNVSQETRNQADELITRCGYSLRDVVTLGIEKLYTERMVSMTVTLRNLEYLSYQFQGGERPSDEYLNTLDWTLKEIAAGHFDHRIADRIVDFIVSKFPEVEIKGNSLPNKVNQAYAMAVDRL